uniref:acyl carrier protein n=1 Tax=Hypnea cervicornis TaxID=387623 RepID=UPI0021B61848|nr:acyl carrier protein [Hypnea cervicornis]UVW80710.1 acyl carrier protein [Hypnea cervicornis]
MLESKFIEDLGADSLDMVELVLAIEESFDIEVPDEQVAKIQDVSQAIELIYKISNNLK